MIVLALVVGCFTAIPTAFAASNNGNNGNSNTGNTGGQSNPIGDNVFPLHQANDAPIDWRGYKEGSDFGLNAAKGETNLVPGYKELGKDPNAVFWHFVNPDKLGGYADITFEYNDNGITKYYTFEGVTSYKSDQHFGVVTSRDWKLSSVKYHPATAPQKGATQFNLSHTAGKDDPKIEIKKIWLNADGSSMCDSETVDLVARFSGIGADTVTSGKTYPVPVGKYTIKETDSSGYKLISTELKGTNFDDDGAFQADAGNTYTITFTNQKETQPEYTIKLTKTVDGELLAEWLSDIDDPTERAEIRAGMKFTLHRVEMTETGLDMRNLGNPVASSMLGEDDTIAFSVADIQRSLSGSLEGWYVVKEEFTGSAIGVFEDIEPLIIYFDGKSATGKALNFNYDATYKIAYSGAPGRNLDGGKTLNNGGEIFYISVVDSTTDPDNPRTYESYCANAGSPRFAGDPNFMFCGSEGYVVVDTPFDGYNGVEYARFLAAFNYVAEHGGLRDNRVVIQVVIWYLLEAVDVDVAADPSTRACINLDLTPEERIDIVAVIEAINTGYTGDGTIVSLVYMVCKDGHTALECQPQLVPISGELVINNKAKTSDPSDPYDFWANIHISVIVNEEEKTNTVTMAGQDNWNTYTVGQAWFTYIQVSELSKTNPLPFDIIENGAKRGEAILSVSDDNTLVITLTFNDGVTLKTGNAVIQVIVSDVESDVQKGPGNGTTKFNSNDVLLNPDGSFTLDTGIDLTQYLPIVDA